MKNTVALYARVSTVDQSVEQQLQLLREYCQKSNYVIVGEFIDFGISAFKKRRPKYLELMEQARLRKVDAILVYKLDRWGRSVQEVVSSLENLKSYGVNFISYVEKEFDTTSPTGQLMFHIVTAFAQFERDLISTRTKLRMAYLKSIGVKLGRPKIKASYQTLSELRAKGLSLSQIGKEIGCDRSTVSKTLKRGTMGVVEANSGINQQVLGQS